MPIEELKIYFSGYEYKVNDGISMLSPTIGDIIDFGENEYFSTVHYLTCIPSDMISTLWDMGIDWEQLDDFDLFIMLTRTLSKDDLKLVFTDLSLKDMEVQINPENGDVILKNNETNQVIDKLAYQKIVSYLRKIHGIEPKVRKAGNQDTKNVLIMVDRDDKRKAAKEAEKHTSQLIPLISAMMRYPGFKYKSNELKECTLYEFMDTVKGASIYISSTSLLQGSYSGFCDTSKIDKKNFDWMRRS
jgi:hypothetical protein